MHYSAEGVDIGSLSGTLDLKLKCSLNGEECDEITVRDYLSNIMSSIDHLLTGSQSIQLHAYGEEIHISDEKMPMTYDKAVTYLTDIVASSGQKTITDGSFYTWQDAYYDFIIR